MNNIRPFESYPGGKSGSGTYQTIINHIPPHDVYYSLYLGNCGVTRNIRPAAQSHLNDLDFDVYKTWAGLGLPVNYLLTNLPAIEILKDITKQLPKRRFIFLDPPYRKDSRKSKQDLYRHEMNDKQHQDLVSQIIAMPQENILITHYPDPMYNEALKNWNQVDYQSITRNGLATERMYFNYTLTDQLHDYRYIGEDFREREALVRQKRNYIKKLNEFEPRLRNWILQELAPAAPQNSAM